MAEDIVQLHWLEDLLRTKGFHYQAMVKFSGIYLVDKLEQENAFGVFAQYRDYDREHKQYPYIDGIYISSEMTVGDPLHEICTAAHEVGHFKLRASGEEYGNSESYADAFATVFLYEFFPSKLAREIYQIHKYGEDACRLAGVRERAEVLAKGNDRERQVGKRILAYLNKHPSTSAGKRATKFLAKSAGIDERIESLQKRLGRVRI